MNSINLINDSSILNSNFIKELPAKEGAKWGNLQVTWKEKIEGREETIDHIYQFTKNRENGDLYLDCTKGKIWTKFLLHIVLEPIILTGKIVFHGTGLATISGLYQEIQQIKEEEQEQEQSISLKTKVIRCLTVIGKTGVDIVRIPVYGLAMEVVAIASLIIGPFAPKEILYEMRNIAGKIDLALHRGDKTNPWIIFRCFQSIGNIDMEWNTHYEDTLYGDEGVEDTSCEDNGVNNLNHFLINLARAQIRFRRTSRALFNCYKGIPLALFPEGKKYVSSTVLLPGK